MMEVSTPEEIKKPWVCEGCPKPKPAAWCNGCPREKGTKEIPSHFVDARLTNDADILVVAEAPVVERIYDVARMHRPFSDASGAIILRTFTNLQAESPAYRSLKVHNTYAVLCSGQDPNKGTIDRCQAFLHTSLRRTMANGKTPTIVAMGMTAVKALGIRAKKLSEVAHRVLQNVPIGDKTYNVVVTVSTKQLVAMAGIYPTFCNDVRRAFQIAAEGSREKTPLEELTKDYVIPKTLDEAKAACELVLNYSESGRPPESWSISVDTETNTLFPHRDSLKVLCVSFAWGTGKATAIPLWHKETPYDPAAIVPYIRAILESKKPKSFHNYKFDKKVFMKLGWEINRFSWDSMLGEHGLEEDKKGLYGLKELTRVQQPEFAEYADVLHEMLEKEEGGSQLDNIRKKRKSAADAEAEKDKPKKLTKKQKRQLDGGYENVPLKELLIYAATDTDMTRRISLKQLHRAAAEEKRIVEVRKIQERDRLRQYPVPHLCTEPKPIVSLIVNSVLPVSGVLARMEFDGIRVDRPYLSKLQEDLGNVILEAQQDLQKMGDREDLNLNSAQAIGNILFSEGFIHPKTGLRTHYPTVTLTKTGQAQTTEKVMKFLVAKYECPFSSKKLIYAKAYKAKNTFCQNVWDLSTADGRLHTNYNIHGTSTGRLSSNDENMQNIPKRLAGYSIKKIFTTSDESLAFINADAKGAEVRIFAAYSGDQQLIQSLKDGLDTHSFFGDKIVVAVRAEPGAKAVLESMGLDDAYPLTYEDFANRETIKKTNYAYGDMLDKFRTAIKRVVFGILYGAGAKKIAETIGISLSQAQSIIDMMFQLFPSIPKYIEQTHWELRTFGFVETYFGRRRRFSVQGASGYLRSRAERQTVNFKIQSTSSDIVMGRLVAIDAPLRHDLRGRLLLTVHDSIGFEIPKKYLPQLPDFISKYLEKGAAEAHPWLPVDFKWDYEVGPSYGELKPYDAYMEGLDIREITNEAAEAYTEEEVRTELASIDEAA